MDTKQFTFVFLAILSVSINILEAENLPTIENQYTPAIEDNSMFIEEAYNQEANVIQHISNFVFAPDLHRNFGYSLTEEFPLFGVENQLSFTLPFLSNEMGSMNGIGDILISYRYQLFYKNDWAAVSPRISIIIPTGDKNNGLGSGTAGLQLNLPISKRWNEWLVTHFNLGMTYQFKYKDATLYFNKDLQGYFVGLSFIYLLHPNFNIMLETLASYNPHPEINNKVSYSNENIIAPGFRFALDIGELQIVHGIEFPLTITSHSSQIKLGLFFYLSFEHPIDF